MTVDNLLTDRFSRNPTINRIINKYPDPPNKDIGEGLKTTMRSMAEAKLKAPTFALEDNSFLVTIEHTPLARPQEIVLQYIRNHNEITNAVARELTAINSENSMTEVFYDLRDAGVIERVPGKAGNKSAWQMTSEARLSEPTSEARPAEPGGSLTTTPRRSHRTQPRRLSRAARQRRR